MNQIFSAAAALAILLLPAALGYMVISLHKKKAEKQIKPLVKTMPRPAGTSLQHELVRQQFDLSADFLMIFWGSIGPIAMIFLQAFFMNKTLSPGLVAFGILAGVGITSYGLISLFRRLEKIKRLQLAHDCEVAVGQALNRLMLKGFHVFHDIQAENFNVDHLVVGQSGVFAVETKGRSKRRGSRGDGKAEYNVDYVDGVLHFPGWSEKKVFSQADRQAKWASTWLSQAASVEVKAVPVIILPGWFINLRDKPTMPVVAMGAVEAFFSKYTGQNLSKEQVARIVYQAEQKSQL